MTNPTKSKKLSPISVRVTLEEREQLLVDAGGLSLSQHIRSRLFQGGEQDILVAERLSPQARQRLLAQILLHLGQSNLAGNMSQMAEAATLGLLELSPEVQTLLFELRAELRGLRQDLIKALGLHPGKDDRP